MGFVDSVNTFRKRHKVYTLEGLSSIVAPIAERYGTGPIQVFGSYARGEATPESDIDLLITPGRSRVISNSQHWPPISKRPLVRRSMPYPQVAVNVSST